MSESSSRSHVDPEDTINILVATDIHLGFDYSKKRGLFFTTVFFNNIAANRRKDVDWHVYKTEDQYYD